MFQLKKTCAFVSMIALSLLVAGSAFAVPQFTPSPTALLHTLTGQPGQQPGVLYNSGGTGSGASGGQIVYTNTGGGTGNLDISSRVDVMNYYDPNNGACATDLGSNCSYNFATDLDFTVQAVLNGLAVVDYGGGYFGIDIMFETAGGGSDFSWTDPTDGNSNMLSATWTAGTFNNNPTTGLQASLIYDTNTNTVLNDDITVTGFATITGGLYASMFGADLVLVDLSNFFDFSPTFSTITAQVLNTGEVPSFTAEINGEIFRVDSGQFVPEPGTALLVGLGLAVLGRRGRRS
jgi:hypothetical protein